MHLSIVSPTIARTGIGGDNRRFDPVLLSVKFSTSGAAFRIKSPLKPQQSLGTMSGFCHILSIVKVNACTIHRIIMGFSTESTNCMSL